MAKQGSIDGKRITLRLLSERDATGKYCAWLNDPQVNKFLDTKGSTIEELKEYVRAKEKSASDFLYGIFLKENGAHIGNVKLEIDAPKDAKKTANIGIVIGEKGSWGKGYAAESIALLSGFALGKLGLDGVWAGIVVENIPSIRAFEKAGFEVGPEVEKVGPGGKLRKVRIVRMERK